MSILFLEYPPCSTCQKAKRWLDEHHVSYTSRHIKENNPTAEELTEWYKKSGLPLKKFFNTSGHGWHHPPSSNAPIVSAEQTGRGRP